MHPLTGGQPKEMLLVRGRPMISYTVSEAARSGLEELYIVINKEKRSLWHYLNSDQLQRDIRSEGSDQDVSIPRLTFVDQPIPAGSGDAIYRVKEFIAGESFALMMPDFIFFGHVPALSQMIKTYERFGHDTVGVLSLDSRQTEGFGNVGIIEGNELEVGIVQVRGLSGKVAGPLTITDDERILKAVGRWIIGPHFFSYLERTRVQESEWDETSALQLLCKERRVLGKVLEGNGFDVGNPAGYHAAERFAAEGS